MYLYLLCLDCIDLLRQYQTPLYFMPIKHFEFELEGEREERVRERDRDG